MTVTLYTDYDVDFTRNTFSGDISVKTNLESIRQSITNLLLTRPGERPFTSSDMSVGLQDLFFELSSDKSMFLVIHDKVRAAINRHEPRVKFKDFIIETDQEYGGGNGIVLRTEYYVYSTTSNITSTSTMTDAITITVQGPQNG